MNRLPKPKEINYGFIEFSLKLPSVEFKSSEEVKKYAKKNFKISLAHKFKTPEDLERYIKSKKDVPPLP